jgi:hypothetical protein
MKPDNGGKHPEKERSTAHRISPFSVFQVEGRKTPSEITSE